jgi:hypothetical protein
MTVMKEGLPMIRVDFQNADSQGRVRLNTAGALADIATMPTPLAEGSELLLIDAELRAKGIARFSESEDLWTAVVDWDEVRESAE